MKNRIPYLLVLGVLLMMQPERAKALGGAYLSHDPSSLIKMEANTGCSPQVTAFMPLIQPTCFNEHPDPTQFFPLEPGLRGSTRMCRVSVVTFGRPSNLANTRSKLFFLRMDRSGKSGIFFCIF